MVLTNTEKEQVNYLIRIYNSRSDMVDILIDWFSEGQVKAMLVKGKKQRIKELEDRKKELEKNKGSEEEKLIKRIDHELTKLEA